MALPTPLPPQYTLLTAIGGAKLAAANAGGTTVDFKEFTAGDGGGTAYVPAVNSNDYATQTSLINEVYRADIDSKSIDAIDDTIAKLMCKIPMTFGTSFIIREIGLYDTAGDLIAVTIVPDQTFNSGITDTYINSAIQISNTATVNLVVTNALFASLAELEAGNVNNKSVAPDVLNAYLNKSSVALGAGANVSITDQKFFTVTGAHNQMITLFDPLTSPGTKYKRFILQVLHDNVTVTPTSSKFSGVTSRTFNKFDWIVMSHDGTDWYMIS